MLNKKTLLFLLAAILLITFPLVSNRYWIRTFTFILMYAAMAESWNIMGGFTGYISFGHAAFFGLGAYTGGILSTKIGVPFPICIFVAGVVAVIFSLLMGIVILKLKGHYFAMVSFGIAEAVKGIVNNLSSITGGGRGLCLELINNPYLYYYLCFSLMVAAIITTYFVKKSRLGYGLVAIRENEEGAAAMGINTTKYKMIAFAISAIFFGMAGSIYAQWMTYISTPDVFSIKISVTVILITLLGGSGTVIGPIVGTWFYQGLSELFWNNFLIFHNSLLGLMMILVIMFIPKGFMELVSGRSKFSLKLLRENLRYYSE